MSLDIRSEEGHPSRHTLTLYHAGEIAGSLREPLTEHISSCAACQAVLAALESEKRAFQAAHPREVFLAQIQARTEATRARAPWFSNLFFGMGRYAIPVATASILLLVAGIWIGRRVAEPGIRIKGSELTLSMVVQEGDSVRVANPQQPLHPGDRIQFRLSGPAGLYLWIIGIDEQSHVSVYYPAPNTTNLFEGGANRPIEGSVLLDATLGKERVFAVLCPQPARTDDLVQKIREYPGGLISSIDQDRLPIDGGCRQTSVLLTKGQDR